MHGDPGEIHLIDEKARQAALISAITTEHFVLQTAASATTSEATGRASLYVTTLSSALVAMGFASQSLEVFVPFAATVLPAVFVLGVFTVFRLVDTGLETMGYLTGIARIRSYYRTLTPDAAEYFAASSGRWPETQAAPAFRLGIFVAFITTNASMIAFINSVVAGAGVALLLGYLVPRDRTIFAVSSGIAAAVALMAVFLVYQQWRYRIRGPAQTLHAP